MSAPPLNHEQLLEALTLRLAPFAGQSIGLAVSGGSDSRALLELATQWAKANKSLISVVTVDHDLRADSRAEAESVQKTCEELGVSHQILTWEKWQGHGNLQAEARRARYHLIAGWATGGGLAAVALGHTADDVVETFLMRLGRSAGVDGLARMQPEFRRNGTLFLRPMLDLRRDDLRAYLRGVGSDWIDDPSNQDSRFERVKIRKALPELADIGLETQKIVQSAENLGLASDALRYYTAREARNAVSVRDGDVTLEFSKLASLPEEIQRRLLLAAIMTVSPSDYGPRAKSLGTVLQRLKAQGTCTLAGCVLQLFNSEIRVFRESSAASENVECDTLGEVEWDNRWRIEGPFPKGAHVAVLGEEGLRQCPDWRETARSRLALLASPAIWVGSELISAPLAQPHNKNAVKPLNDMEELLRNVLSH